MKAEIFDIGRLHFVCGINREGNEIAYILYPADTLQDWIEDAAKRYGISIIVITGFDWDNDLTPWPAPGEPKGCPDFTGQAPALLNTLTKDVIPAVERRYGLRQEIVRSLIGVSLSGLFALWQWPQCDAFRNIATLSGSFWYEGFEQWVLRQSFTNKNGLCYMLLGIAEPHSPIPAFRKVGSCTETIVGYLRRQGVNVTYDMVPGNHFQFGLERLDKAFSHLYKSRKQADSPRSAIRQ